MLRRLICLCGRLIYIGFPRLWNGVDVRASDSDAQAVRRVGDIPADMLRRMCLHGWITYTSNRMVDLVDLSILPRLDS